MLRAIFNLPWPVLALISAGLFWLAQDGHRRAVAFEAEKAEALRGEAPAPVPLDDFSDADVGLAREVHVTAWVNLDYSYELTKQRKGTDTVRRMHVLFGPGDAADGKVARGVVVLEPGAVDRFIALVAANQADPADPRLPFHLNGTREGLPDLADMVDDALREQGLVKAADFLAVKPFLDGRAAGLAPDEDAPARFAMVTGGLGALVGLFAAVKALSGRRRGGRRVTPRVPEEGASLAASAVAAPLPPAAMPSDEGAGGLRYGTLPTPGPAVWSPLEAVKAKQMMQAAPSARGGEWEPKAPPVARGSGAGRGLGVIRKLGMAVVAYGVLFLAFGAQNSPFSLEALIPEAGFGVAQVAEFQTAPADLPGMDGTGPAGEGASLGGQEAGRDTVAPLDVPPSVARDVATDAAALRIAWLGDLRGQVLWVLVGAGLMAVAAGAALVLRRGARRGGGADPWDRLSDRLR